MTTTPGSPARPVLVPPPVVEVRGRIAPDLAPYARGVVTHVLEALGRPAHAARVRVVRHADPARERPVTASVLVELDTGHVHAHVTAAHPREAVDLLADRLRRRVRDSHRTRPRGAARSPARPARVTRHDQVHAVPIAVTEAAAILVDLDEDVHLFLEHDTGQPAVVYRAGPTGLRVAFRDGAAAAVVPGHVTRSDEPARRLPVEHALDHLALAGLPFLFFTDPAGDGRLLHRDGDGVVLVDVVPGAGTDRPAEPGPTDHEVGAAEH